MIESEEGKNKIENGEMKNNEDMNDSGVAAEQVHMPYHQQQIISIDDDEFPSEDEKVRI